ncbi:MAG: ABC transporter permease [Ruminococcus sp.]|nr:ABC transporter permease [Ruminococcus sp.]
MNDDNIYGTTGLDDFDYTPPEPKKEGPTGVSAPVLDDFGYSAPAARKDGPTGVSAPVLDDMDVYTPSYGDKKGAPTGVAAPVLDDDTYSYSKPAEPQKLILSDQDIIDGLTPELKERFDTLTADQQQKIIEMRRSQLGAEAPAPQVSAAILDDEDSYTPPPKAEEPAKPAEPLTAPILDEEPEPPKYVPKYVDEDLENAKKQGAKAAVSSGLVQEQKDSKESLRMMLELKEERRADLAKKGFKLLLVTALIGIIAAVAFGLLYSGTVFKCDSLGGFSEKVSDSSAIIAVLMAVSGLTLLSGFGAFKSLTSFIYIISGLLQIFPGLAMIPQYEGNLVLVILLYAVALLGTIGVIVMLSASEAVGAYFSKNSR